MAAVVVACERARGVLLALVDRRSSAIESAARWPMVQPARSRRPTFPLLAYLPARRPATGDDWSATISASDCCPAARSIARTRRLFAQWRVRTGDSRTAPPVSARALERVATGLGEPSRYTKAAREVPTVHAHTLASVCLVLCVERLAYWLLGGAATACAAEKPVQVCHSIGLLSGWRRRNDRQTGLGPAGSTALSERASTLSPSDTAAAFRVSKWRSERRRWRRHAVDCVTRKRAEQVNLTAD